MWAGVGVCVGMFGQVRVSMGVCVGEWAGVGVGICECGQACVMGRCA